MTSVTTSTASKASLPEVSSASSAADSPSPSSSPFSQSKVSAAPQPTKNHEVPATSASLSELDIVFHPNDADVLCGRGRAIRLHPGNQVYNQLLRDGYEEYSNAKKGTKLDIVRRIVVEIRDERGGRFLEKLVGGGNYFIDIGNERAMNKTAQAFRDMRVAETNGTTVGGPTTGDGTVTSTEEKGGTSPTSLISPPKTAFSTKQKGAGGGGTAKKSTSTSIQRPAAKNLSAFPRKSLLQNNTKGQGSALLLATAAAKVQTNNNGTLPGQPRRLTFSERVKLLQQQRQKGSDDDDDDDDDDNSNDDTGSEGDEVEKSDGSEQEGGGEVSETETEDSFPTYNRKNNEE